MRAACCGAGGFIGGHLVKYLLDKGYDEIRAIDIKPFDQWDQNHEDDPRVKNYSHDLRTREGDTPWMLEGVDEVYNLAADMGGMGFLATHRVDCLHSVDVTSNVIRVANKVGVPTLFYSSSACVYPDYKQQVELVSLKEDDAWPADPEPAYGLEKLYGEELCKWYRSEYGMNTKVARFHNIYGPFGTFSGGREKAPAAICRKVIEAKLSGKHQIEIWGDGEQTRSFCYVDDCTKGVDLITHSDLDYPINLGSDELVSINQLVSVAEELAGVKLERHYNLDAPQGVRGRNSDNTLIKKELKWAPSITLVEGMTELYHWIESEMT